MGGWSPTQVCTPCRPSDLCDSCEDMQKQKEKESPCTGTAPPRKAREREFSQGCADFQLERTDGRGEYSSE